MNKIEEIKSFIEDKSPDEEEVIYQNWVKVVEEIYPEIEAGELQTAADKLRSLFNTSEIQDLKRQGNILVNKNPTSELLRTFVIFLFALVLGGMLYFYPEVLDSLFEMPVSKFKTVNFLPVFLIIFCVFHFFHYRVSQKTLRRNIVINNFLKNTADF